MKFAVILAKSVSIYSGLPFCRLGYGRNERIWWGKKLIDGGWVLGLHALQITGRKSRQVETAVPENIRLLHQFFSITRATQNFISHKPMAGPSSLPDKKTKLWSRLVKSLSFFYFLTYPYPDRTSAPDSHKMFNRHFVAFQIVLSSLQYRPQNIELLVQSS